MKMFKFENFKLRLISFFTLICIIHLGNSLSIIYHTIQLIMYFRKGILLWTYTLHKFNETLTYMMANNDVLDILKYFEIDQKTGFVLPNPLTKLPEGFEPWHQIAGN